MIKTTKRYASKHNQKNKKKLIKIADLRDLRKVRSDVAGIDVGSENHFVAAPDPSHENKIVVQKFDSFTSSLRECVDWLIKCKTKSVAMEATGVYWMVLHDMLKESKIDVVLVNAHDLKKIKDKKTDVTDAEYLQLYHSYGLLEGAFIPEKEIGELRTILRLREQHVRDAATAIQRMQKALIRMNLRLDNVLSDTSGITGMAIIHAILSGERDPKKLAEYRDARCHKSEEEIEESLKGFYQNDQLFALKQALEQHEFFLAQIRGCDREVEERLANFETVETTENPEENQPVINHKKKTSTKIETV